MASSPERHERDPMSLTPTQVDYLEFIAANQPVLASEVMDGLGAKRRVAYQTLSTLGEMGLLATEPDMTNDYRYRRPDLISIHPERAEELIGYFEGLAMRYHTIAENIESEGEY